MRHSLSEKILINSLRTLFFKKHKEYEQQRRDNRPIFGKTVLGD